MRTVVLTLIAGIGLTACATTRNSDVAESVQVRAAKMVDGPAFDAEASYEKAKDQYADGDFQRAYTSFTAVIFQASEDFEQRDGALMGYADAALALGAEKKYLKTAENAFNTLAENPDLSGELQNRLLSGQVLLELAKGECDDPEVRLNEALEDNLNDPRLWNALGHFHDTHQDWLIALETYIKALHVANEGDYPVAPVINNMGMSLLMQKRPKEALKKFEQAHELNENIRIYDNNRRLALILSGRVDKAVKNLPDKRAAQIYNDAGYFSASTGRTARARYFYKQAIKLSPSYFEKAENNLAALDLEEPKSGA